MPTLKIEFNNQNALEEFATWLCESGEQEYFTWMECQDVPENEIVESFIYHHSKHITSDGDYFDPRWLGDNCNQILTRTEDEN